MRSRFKIDFAVSYRPFVLFFRRPCWHRAISGLTWWERIDAFQTQEEAKAYYEKIKSLPEYLD